MDRADGRAMNRCGLARAATRWRSCIAWRPPVGRTACVEFEPQHRQDFAAIIRVMGHAVTALLGSRSVLSGFAEHEELRAPVAAQAGTWLIPLTDDVLDHVVGLPVGQPLPGFRHLYPKLLHKLVHASARGWIVYIETEYFGGKGRQGAVALRDGRCVHGPQAAEWNCINEALASVGIAVVAPAIDAFETVGLDRHRFTDDWLADADGDAA